jgi:hypothetical protein
MAAHGKHHSVTDEEYFAALPPYGLDLAEDQLEENLTRAVDDEEFPAKDTITQMQIVRDIKEGRSGQASA